MILFKMIQKKLQGNILNNETDKIMYTAPCLVCAAMLFIALFQLPYGYYTLLRLVVCLSSTFLAYLAYEIRKMKSVFLLILIAVLFNPVIPVHLDQETWAAIDVVCGLIFLALVFIFKPSVKKKTKE